MSIYSNPFSRLWTAIVRWTGGSRVLRVFCGHFLGSLHASNAAGVEYVNNTVRFGGLSARTMSDTRLGKIIGVVLQEKVFQHIWFNVLIVPQLSQFFWSLSRSSILMWQIGGDRVAKGSEEHIQSVQSAIHYGWTSSTDHTGQISGIWMLTQASLSLFVPT